METAARISHTLALILQTIRSGYIYGFDIMDITGLPSGRHKILSAWPPLTRGGKIGGLWALDKS